MLALLNDSMPLGKRNFLEYYMLAQKNALTAKNYIAGFIALGLWPVQMAKPLINRLLLENSNKAIEPALTLLRKRLLPE
jgi:hypothetical protein